MAKVTITIRDSKDHVSVIVKPTYLELMKKTTTKEGWTPAQQYAVDALNAIRDLSQKAKQNRVHRALDNDKQKEQGEGNGNGNG